MRGSLRGPPSSCYRPETQSLQLPRARADAASVPFRIDRYWRGGTCSVDDSWDLGVQTRRQGRHRAIAVPISTSVRTGLESTGGKTWKRAGYAGVAGRCYNPVVREEQERRSCRWFKASGDSLGVSKPELPGGASRGSFSSSTRIRTAFRGRDSDRFDVAARGHSWAPQANSRGMCYPLPPPPRDAPSNPKS